MDRFGDFLASPWGLLACYAFIVAVFCLVAS